MKKILISLSVITIVAGVALGVTGAYFSDTETSTGNTFSSGVVDISVDNQNPWTRNWKLEGMNPCESKEVTFNIHNPGDDPVNVWKTVNVTGTKDEPITEPECVYEGGKWDGTNQACDIHGSNWDYTSKSDLQYYINYDLSVEVPIKDNPDNWYQTIYKEEDGVKVSDVNGKDILLGMIPAGGDMEATQSYQLECNTRNWAQADTMNFDVKVYAEQLKGELILRTKSNDPDWQIKKGSGGKLTYNLSGPTFDYGFYAWGLEANKGYQLIYYPDPWKTNKEVKLIGGSMTANSEGKIMNNTYSVDLGMDLPDWSEWNDQNHPEGAKIWLVRTDDLTANGHFNAWNEGEYLFETALINYEDTND